MKERLTRPFDEWPCRIAGGCPAEVWIIGLTGISTANWAADYICNTCPFEKFINRLAELEDEKDFSEENLKMNNFEIYEKIKKIHQEEVPFFRFGQLITNFEAWHKNRYGNDTFYLEDVEYLHRFREFILNIKE